MASGERVVESPPGDAREVCDRVEALATLSSQPSNVAPYVTRVRIVIVLRHRVQRTLSVLSSGTLQNIAWCGNMGS